MKDFSELTIHFPSRYKYLYIGTYMTQVEEPLSYGFDA